MGWEIVFMREKISSSIGTAAQSLQLTHAPALLETRQRPISDPVKQVKADEQANRRGGNANHDVVQNVVSHLMAKDKESLRRAGMLDRCVPDHYALGWSKACDVGVERGHFLAGLHQEHAVTGNFQAASLGDSLNGVYQLRIAFIQRLKFVE